MQGCHWGKPASHALPMGATGSKDGEQEGAPLKEVEAIFLKAGQMKALRPGDIVRHPTLRQVLLQSAVAKCLHRLTHARLTECADAICSAAHRARFIAPKPLSGHERYHPAAKHLPTLLHPTYQSGGQSC